MFVSTIPYGSITIKTKNPEESAEFGRACLPLTLYAGSMRRARLASTSDERFVPGSKWLILQIGGFLFLGVLIKELCCFGSMLGPLIFGISQVGACE